MRRDEWFSPEDIRVSLVESLNDPLFGRRLTAIAAGIMRGKTFHGRPLGNVFAPFDFIQTSICKALSGERRMRANDSDGFFLFLVSCIESEISNTITGKESSMVGALDQSTHLHDDAVGIGSASAQSVEDLLLEEEQQRELLALFKEDPKLEGLARLALRDGLRGRKEFALSLKISPDEVTNLKKRMQRLYSEHLGNGMRRKERHA